MQNGGLKMFITYKNHKGGINNLCAVFDAMGNYANSLKGKDQAIKNHKMKVRKNK